MSIQLKRSLSSNIDQNYVLAQGQVGIEMPSSTNSSSSPFKMKIGDGVSSWQNLPYHGEYKETDLSGYTPTSRTINNKPLTSNITLTATDVNARPNTWNPSLTECSGTLTVAKGGTGVTTLDALKTALGISSSGSSGSSWGACYDTSNQAHIYYTSQNNQSGRPSFSGSTAFIHISDWPSSISMNAGSSMSGFSMVLNQENGLTWHTISNIPCLTASGYASSFYIGYSSQPWTTVYAKTGSIQTSDRSAKTNIQYLDDADLAIVDTSDPTSVGCTTADVLTFIQTFRPASFEYLHDSEDCPTEFKQLGMIADDIADLPIYKYIGTYNEWDEEPEILDEFGNVIRPKQEAGHARGLQAVPLATCALTACKYLLQHMEILEEKLA